MAFDFVWNGNGGTDGDVNDARNYDAISIRNAAYQWTASASGTDEYYLELSGGGDPGIAQEPDFIVENGSDMTNGTMGSLAAGEYDYGDNDTLGFSTVYVRLTSGAADPDSHSVDYIQFHDVPYASQNIDLGGGSTAMSLNLDAFEAISFNNVSIPHDYEGTIGTATDPWGVKLSGVLHIGYIKDDLEEPSGSTRVHIDLLDSNCSVKIDRSATTSADSGFNPIRLHINHASTKVYQRGGRVSLAVKPGEKIIASLISVSGEVEDAFCRIGYPGGQANVSVTDVEVWTGGDVIGFDGPSGNLNLFGGIFRLKGEGAFGTATVRDDGALILESTGSLSGATINMHKSLVDTWAIENAMTIGAVNLKDPGARFRENDDITITTLTRSYAGKRELVVN